MSRLVTLMGVIIIFVFTSLASFAQSGSEKNVEDLYDKFDRQESRKSRQSRARARKRRKVKKPQKNSLSELANLAPFSDIATITRKYLPKTGRFELSGAGLTSINNPFFNNLGIALRGAYYFKEKWGIEAMYFFLSNSQREVTANLEDKRQVKTQNLVSPKGYFGLDIKWAPIYGKMTLLNKQIVPFDMYFQLGGGMTQTDKSGSEPTIHIGTGQIFALSKSSAFRWDFSWSFYQAKFIDENDNEDKTNQDDLLISVGMSFFFPEATYR